MFSLGQLHRRQQMSNSKFFDFLEHGLRNTDSGLGDRSKYIGSSDIGQCMKKSYLSKTVGEAHDLKQLIIFQRGHLAEGIVRDGLANNPKKITFQEQVAVKGYGEWPFVQSHIDFLVNFPNEDVVVECKSISSPLPDDKPRLSWIYQVQLQIKLAQLKTGRHTRGIIVAINVNTGDRLAFDIEPSELILNAALKRASKLWDALQSKCEPDGELSDLCTYCSFKTQCSTLLKNGETLPDEVNAMVERLKEISPLEKEAAALKENIKAFLEAANIKKGIGKRYSIMMSERSGRESVSIEHLKANYPEIANIVIKPGAPFKQLKVV